jgi:hypothetical protein
MVYDSSRGVSVLFGGYGEPGYLQDTWEWNGSTWSQRFTAHLPPARDWSAMTYDGRRHVVVLFGGTGASGGLLNDTWEYDGNDWTLITTADAPPARRGHALAFDAIRGRTVLFGGQSDVDLNDTWEYDGTDWTQISLPTAPQPRLWHSMAYDSALDGVVVFGGDGTGYVPLNDTWIYDGLSWRQITSPSQPSERFWAPAVFDSAHSQLVLFGGTQDTNTMFVFSETWTLLGVNTLPASWAQAHPATLPPARSWQAMDYDSARGVTVMFGGSTGGPGSFRDTWEWDGFNWSLKAPQTSPPALEGAAMAYDSRRHVSVLFGGETGSPTLSAATWEWDGTAWTQKSLPVSPPARVFGAMTYDSLHGVMLLFGGSGNGLLGDTWQYDGTTWAQLTPAHSPTARFGPALSFDSARGRSVLFGGEDSAGRLGDTWEWDGTNWSQISTSTAPYARFWASMAFDAKRGKTVLFGGDHIQPYALGPTNDTWDWDGSQWTRDWTGAAPAVRAGQAMGYDSARDRIVLFGGTNAATSPPILYGDTWELGTGIVTPPGSPTASITPAALEFGSVDVGAVSLASPVYIASSGTGPLVDTISTSGDFALSSIDCPSTPNPLAAGTTCVAFVTFTPTLGGDRYGSLTLTGNVSGGTQSIPLHGTGVAADFSISSNPTTISMVFGGPNPTSSITTAVVGAPGNVSLLALTTDPGVTATFSSNPIAAGAGSTVSIVLASSIGPGYYGVRLVGTEGTATHYVDIALHITQVPDFSMAVSPDTMNVVQGSSGTATVTTSAVGAVGAVQLSSSQPANGLAASFSPSSAVAGGTSTLTISAAYGTPAGTYTVSVSGLEGSITHSTTITVNVAVKTIVNGDLETGDLSGWDQAGVVSIVHLAHSGAYAAQIGSSSASADSYLDQTFAVPATGGKLTFWYWMSCSDKVKNDWFTVTLLDGITGVLTTVQSPVCTKTGWTKVTVNLSSHAGHFVTVNFLNHDDGVASTPTYTILDDVALG